MEQQFESFADFYPFYLSEHQNRTCRRLHFIGSTLGLGIGLRAILRGKPKSLLKGIALGYAFSWVGHFFFEKNKPATFQHPLYSFIGDWVMWKDIVTKQIEF